MTIHGAGFIFFTSLAFLLGTASGWHLKNMKGETPVVVPVIFATLGFIISLVTLVARGLNHV